ncbi:MAG TPA: type II toxin-antitoxin system Phd/YefM family antitoxin [Steroidobacteraceae bacterium]|nr:type II toxin-antitoxin system Phd/YefM family antitoxin [Steroidobacteraceae bacterium]
MTKVTSGEFTRSFGRYRALARREPVVVTHHGRDDVVLIAADDYAQLRQYELRASRNAQLPQEVDKVPIPEATSKLVDEYQP